jgi:surface antigen
MACIVSSGYSSPIDQQLSSASSANETVAVAEAAADSAPVDQVRAADLAVNVATTANLSVSSNVSNKSISMSAKEELAQVDDTVIVKPQIAQPTEAAEVVTSYYTVEGDSVGTIADKFGISEQTVRWANNLTGDNVAVGITLTVPSIDGVVYTVKEGDNVEALADKYQSDSKSIITVNDLEIEGLVPGAKILLPAGNLPENERPGYKPATSSRSTSSSSATDIRYGSNAMAMVGNRYSYGYCTYYAYNRRAQLGRPIGSLWGNATTWAAYARGAGYVVDRTPEVGAVMQTSGGWGGYGHVAVVESLNADGSITISEMNYAGWNVISSRIVSNPRDYNFIH